MVITGARLAQLVHQFWLQERKLQLVQLCWLQERVRFSWFTWVGSRVWSSWFTFDGCRSGSGRVGSSLLVEGAGVGCRSRSGPACSPLSLYLGWICPSWFSCVGCRSGAGPADSPLLVVVSLLTQLVYLRWLQEPDWPCWFTSVGCRIGSCPACSPVLVAGAGLAQLVHLELESPSYRSRLPPDLRNTWLNSWLVMRD